jgi:hypothetical protein
MVSRGLRQDLKRQGGFSVDIQTGKSPSEGYAVSDQGAESVGRVKSRAKTGRRIQSYVGEHQQALSAPGKYLGGWREHQEGKPSHDVLDVSQVYPASSAGLAQAHLKTVIHNQKAYYNVGRGEEVGNPAFEDDPSAQGRRLARMSGKNTASALPNVRAVNEFFQSAMDRR